MKASTAKYKLDNFSWKDDKCPICKKRFRSDACPHTNRQARERLHKDYVKAIASE